MVEISERTGADMRWLQTAFDEAARSHAKAVVIGLQAGGVGLDKYTHFVKLLANLGVKFARPVLMLNGDSHLYGAGQPLGDPCTLPKKSAYPD